MQGGDAADVRPMITNDLSSRAASAAFILPTPSSIEIRPGFVSRNVRGRIVSSIMIPATPAASSSCTVRMPDVVCIDS